MYSLINWSPLCFEVSMWTVWWKKLEYFSISFLANLFYVFMYNNFWKIIFDTCVTYLVRLCVFWEISVLSFKWVLSVIGMYVNFFPFNIKCWKHLTSICTQQSCAAHLMCYLKIASLLLISPVAWQFWSHCNELFMCFIAFFYEISYLSFLTTVL